MTASLSRASLMCLALAVPGWAADAPPKDEPPRQEKPHDAVKGREKQVARLAEEFGVTQDEVRELRAKGMGWGEVRHAFAISRRSGQPVAEILKQRDSGMGWGAIADKYGFKLGDVAGKGKDRSEPAGRPGGRDAGKPTGEGRDHGRGRGPQGHGGPKR